MLAAVLENDDVLYWEVEVMKQPLPKRKWPQAEEESLDDSVLTVKTTVSVRKTQKSALKGNTQTNTESKMQKRFASNSKTVTLQVTTISQLMEMVSVVQQENKTIMSRFDQLTKQILIAAQNQPLQCQARGHGSESGHPK